MWPTLTHPDLNYRLKEPGISRRVFRFCRQPQLYFYFAAVLIFALNLDLVWPTFVPNLSDITPFAEAAHINNGKKLVEGTIVSFGYSPLSAFLYAITYLPVKSSPYWFVYSSWVGRILLFGLLWISAYLVGQSYAAIKTGSSGFTPLLMIVLAFISPAMVNLLVQPSHALFAAMSALALWQVLSFYRSNETKHLVGASFLVAASVLTRSGEGLILWGALVSLAFWLCRRLSVTAALTAAILPCGAILAGYLLIYSSLTGKFDLGMAEYAYFTFEQGHGLAYKSQYDPKADFYVQGQIDARRLFGMPEENGYSVLAGIKRNPQAYLERIPRLMSLAPREAVMIYGGILGLVVLVFAVRGAAELAWQKHYALLAILLIWGSYVALYPLLVFQPTHFLFPYYIVLVLAALGLSSTLRNRESRAERYLWYIAFAATASAGIISGHPRLVSIGLFLLLGFAHVWTVMRRHRDIPYVQAVGMAVLVAGLLLHVKFPVSKFVGDLRRDRELQATLFMRDNLERGTPVAAYAPKNIWIAELTYIPMFKSAVPQITTDDDFSNWLKHNRIHAIYVDPYLKIFEPSLFTFVKRHVGHDLSIAFSTADGAYQVLYATQTYSGDVLQRHIERPWYSSRQRFSGPS